ncbi:hypothetical protein B296_00009142 [Ensete ventricosum]|uniref:Uncharacterized protein n=1 Tax=Ensete ventricosum TaxID=4639 RepID=A0A426ZUH1_ENSVE|nr:hypothetical protein B296_00009142 [Ensete ventricosum]
MRRRPWRRSRHLAVRGRHCPKVSSSVAFGKRQRLQTSPTFGEEEAAPLPHPRLIPPGSGRRQSKSTVTNLFRVVTRQKQPCIVLYKARSQKKREKKTWSLSIRRPRDPSPTGDFFSPCWEKNVSPLGEKERGDYTGTD